MTDLVLGVDGGNTKTVALLAQADGSVIIPDALRPYMGADIIRRGG